MKSRIRSDSGVIAISVMFKNLSVVESEYSKGLVYGIIGELELVEWVTPLSCARSIWYHVQHRLAIAQHTPWFDSQRAPFFFLRSFIQHKLPKVVRG